MHNDRAARVNHSFSNSPFSINTVRVRTPKHQICTVDDSDIISTQMYGEWEKYRLVYIEMAWCDKPMDQFMTYKGIFSSKLKFTHPCMVYEPALITQVNQCTIKINDSQLIQ